MKFWYLCFKEIGQIVNLKKADYTACENRNMITIFWDL